MRAKKCDRCGGFYSCYNHTPKLKLVKVTPTPSNYLKQIDLCQECEKKLVDWFENSKSCEAENE